MGNTTSGSQRGGGAASSKKLLNRIELHDAVVPFDNMTADCIARLWERFVSDAASFAVTEVRLLQSCSRPMIGRCSPPPFAPSTPPPPGRPHLDV